MRIQRATTLTMHTALPHRSLPSLYVWSCRMLFWRPRFFPISSLITGSQQISRADASCHFRHLLLPIELCFFRVSLLRQAGPPVGHTLVTTMSGSDKRLLGTILIFWLFLLLIIIIILIILIFVVRMRRERSGRDFMPLTIWVRWVQMTQLSSASLSLPVSWILLVTVQTWPPRV